jgi:1,4-dihydroxy-2-naphthoate octaprenyltransferase
MAGRERWKGVYLELRVVPLLLWSFSGVALGTAVGWEDGARSHGLFLAAAGIGALLQGFVAHTVNDVADWRSGTDRDPAPRLLSGGSPVLGAGLLTERELHRLGITAGVVATGAGFWVAAERGWWLLSLGALGLIGAVGYTLPPVRAAYRPFAGETIAFVCVAACVIGGAGVQTGTPSWDAVLVGAAHAASCVAMLMLHHYLDRGPDARAVPRKTTTIVYLGRRARRYGIGWSIVALLLWTVTAIQVTPGLVAATVGAALGVAAHAVVQPDDHPSVTRVELAVIGLGIAGALTATIIIVPSLAWIVAIPVTVIAIELALIRQLSVRPPAPIAQS